MSISTLSVRVPKEVKQEIVKFAKEEKLLQTSEAARKLLAIGLDEWHKEKALKLLETGKATFNRAAEIAGMNVWEFADLVKERKIVWIKDMEGLKEDINAALKR